MKFGRARGRLTGKTETICLRCNTTWLWAYPAATMQMICQPDENTWLWWECPDCGWQTEPLDQKAVQWSVAIGIPWHDWSLAGDTPQPCTLVEEAHMIQIGEMPSADVQQIMCQAWLRCIYEADR